MRTQAKRVLLFHSDSSIGAQLEGKLIDLGCDVTTAEGAFEAGVLLGVTQPGVFFVEQGTEVERAKPYFPSLPLLRSVSVELLTAAGEPVGGGTLIEALRRAQDGFLHGFGLLAWVRNGH